MAELIQIVDEHDQPIGEASIDEAQHKALRHRIVRVMVEDGKGKVLLQLRSKDVHDSPNTWDHSAAGHVDSGETYIEAAKRELAEEIGLRDVKLTEKARFFSDRTSGTKRFLRFNRLYRVVVPADTKFTIDEEEVAGVKWFTIDEVKQLVAEYPEQVTDGIQKVITTYY